MKFTSRSVTSQVKAIEVIDMPEINGVYTHEEIRQLADEFRSLVEDLDWAANATAIN